MVVLFLGGVAGGFAGGAEMNIAAGLSGIQTAGQPNIIFILFDDLGYADLGVYGNQFIRTPNIDALARDGMRFTQYYANASTCSSSRAAIMSGKYQQRYGIRTNLNGDNRRGVPDTLLADVLRGEGYATAHVGKWHIGREPSFVPIDQGFDLDVRFESALTGFLRSYFDPSITINDTLVVEHEGHLTEILTDYAIDFMNDNAAGPFFLNLWYGAPHKPLEPPLHWQEQYPDTDEGRFAALVSNADEQIARILQTLDDLAIAGDTLVIITSDNGGEGAWHGEDPATGPSNGIYRGGKGQTYEGGIRVPMMARWNGVIARETVDDSVIAGFDMFPTIAEMVGADASGLDLNGESFLSVLLASGPKSRLDTLFFESKISPFRADNDPDDDTSWNQYAVRRDNWKLVFRDQEIQLYDIVADPEEATNLADTQTQLVTDLSTEHRDWRFANGLIEHAVDTISGDVLIVGDEWSFNGGAVELEPNTLYDIDDLDFSFVATITPSGIGSRQVIAKFGNAWRLELRPTGTLGLRMIGPTGEATLLQSNTVLKAGIEYKVAISVFAWRIPPENSVKLYIDGILEAETIELPEVAHVSRALIGNIPNLGNPFIGIIKHLELWSLALNAGEVQSLTGG